jgi:diguanylate cyclase (GGDEF)-like protein
LIGELDHLRVARHAWRDTQESTILAFARIDNGIDKIDTQLHNDPTTGLPNRIGLEVMLEAWWQEGRHQQQPIAAVLLDIDALGKHNRAHGALVGDAILYQVARYLRTTVDAADAVGRAGGGSFVVVMPSGGIQAGCATAELLRQSIEQIHFKQGDETLRITVSAGVAESGTEDRNRAPMFARLAESLKMAKRSGHNQTFFFDGEGPRLVDPPTLTVAPLEITI